MIIAKSIADVRRVIREVKGKVSIGFVATMGALHQGHLSLVRQARKDCAFVAVSIFVNPAQFGPKEDLTKYPRSFKKDCAMLKKEGVDLVFSPQTKEIYPKNFSIFINEKALSHLLCGASRPDHFSGVLTVVAKLFNIIEPDIAYFGAKDYQQAMLIKRMVCDLNFPIKIKLMPIVRDNTGLAISSRNIYLSKNERAQAILLSQVLKRVEQAIICGQRSPQKILSMMRSLLKAKTIKIDYIKIVDADNLQELKRIKGKVLIALAVFVGKVRLIDNIRINV